jgi:hypothetical protein
MSVFRRFKKTQCSKVQKMLSAYMDRQLSLQEQEMVEQHLRICRNCQAELDSLQRTVSLLRCIPLVGPQRSFAISEAKPVPRRSALGALRIATVVAVLCLATIFCGDVMHVFDTPPPPSPGPWEPSQWERYTWPLRETEYGLLGVTLTLAGVTIAYWRKKRTSRESPRNKNV